MTFLIGDDIFVSYSRSDGATFAAGLATELTSRGFSCRLDQWGTESGKQMPQSLRDALRRSALLVLVGTEGAARSVHVSEEVRTMKRLKRPVVPIIFEGVRLREEKTPKGGRLVHLSDLSPDASVTTASEAVWAAEIEGQAIACEDNGALQTGKPSDSTLNTIEKTFTFRTRDQRLRISSTLIGVILISLICASVLTGIQEIRSKKEATIAEARAVQARKDAQAAEGLSIKAKGDAQAAESEKLSAETVRDSALREAGRQSKIAFARKLSVLANGLRQRAVAVAGRTALSQDDRAPWLLETSLLLGIKALKAWNTFDVMDTAIETRALLPPRIETPKAARLATQLAFSPNRKYLLQLDDSFSFFDATSSLSALDVRTGREVDLPLDKSIVFAENAKYVAGLTRDSSNANVSRVSIFDSDTLNPVGSFPVGDALELEALSPDGRYVLLHDQRNQQTLIAGIAGSLKLAYPNSVDVAFAADDNLIVRSEKAVAALAIDRAGAAAPTRWKVPAVSQGLSISPDGRWAAVVIGRNLSILRTSSGAAVCTADITSPVMQMIGPRLRFSPNGERMAVEVNGSITIYAVETCRRLFAISYSLDGDLPKLEFSPDAEWFLEGTRDGTYVLDSATGAPLAVVPEERVPDILQSQSDWATRWATVNPSATLIAVIPDERSDQISHSHKSLHLYNTEQLPYRISAFDDAETLSFSRDGARLLQYRGGFVNVIATDTRRLVARMPVSGTCRRFHFETQDRVYALEGDSLRTFDYVKGVELPRRVFEGEAENCVLRRETGVAASSSGRSVTVNIGKSKPIKLSLIHDDGSIGPELSLVPYAEIPFGSTLDLSSSGRFVTTGRVVYDTFKQTETVVLDTRGVDAMIDTDDRFLVSASTNGDVVIHDLAAKKNVYRHAMGRDAHILAVAYSKSRPEVFVAYKYWRDRPGVYLRSLSWQEPDAFANSACRWVTHDLGAGERQRYLDGDREPICGH